MYRFLFILISVLFCLFSCNKRKNIQQASDSRDTIENIESEAKENNDRQQQLAKERHERDISYLLDSICRTEALTDVFSQVNKQIDAPFFENEFEYTSDAVIEGTTDYTIPVKFRFGNLFSHGCKHLIVSQYSPFYMGAFIDVFQNKDGQFKHLISLDERAVINDTIKDINGDGLKDLDIWSYSHSGCCRRNLHTVFLQKQDGTFTEEYEFINPNFYPKEGLIRGVTYGYDSKLYKYKWNGWTVDTLEFVFRKGKNQDDEYFEYYRINSKGDTSQVKNIPKEYLSIDDFDSLGIVYISDEEN